MRPRRNTRPCAVSRRASVGQRPVVDHACLARPPAWRPLLTERSTIACVWKIWKHNLRILGARNALGLAERLVAPARCVALNPVRAKFVARAEDQDGALSLN